MATPSVTRIDLPPDAFAVVMATGIVSVAAQDHAYPRIAVPLAVVATVAFALLVALTLLAPRHTDLHDPDVALRMFTFVAACAVLGVVFVQHATVLWVLGAAALLGWLVLMPLAARDVRSRPRDELRDHAHGAWLLPSVATAGLATTAADLAHTATLVVLGALAWLLAVAAYLAVAWLIVWRALAAPFVPDEVTPDSWILMGALAIATLSGDHLLTAADRVGGLDWLAAVLRPVTLGTWAVAALWIPLLLYAEVWRIDQRAGSLHFAGVWWSAVFPLGMFAAASAATANTLHVRSLMTVSLVFFWIAATVWLLVAVGMAHALLRRRVRDRRSPS